VLITKKMISRNRRLFSPKSWGKVHLLISQV
jgi:hypothetical protein